MVTPAGFAGAEGIRVNQQELSLFIWSAADLLRGDYKQSEYGRAILLFTVLRKLDCVLEPLKSRGACPVRGQEEAEAQSRAILTSEGQAELLQHLDTRLTPPDRRPGPHPDHAVGGFGMTETRHVR